MLTLPAVQLPGDWTPSPELFAVHAWRVGCMEDYEAHRKKLEKYTGNVSRRKAFLKRHGLKVPTEARTRTRTRSRSRTRALTRTRT